MKIRLELRPDDGSKPTLIDFSPNMRKIRENGYPGRVWADMANTPLGQGKELKSWKIVRAGEKWKGKAGDDGPPIHDGDLIVFTYTKTQAAAAKAS